METPHTLQSPPLPIQRARRCCVDRLSWQRLPGACWLKGHETAAVIATCRRWFEAGGDSPTLLLDVAKGGGIRTEQRPKAIWRR